jgi:hypothetical protein
MPGSEFLKIIIDSFGAKSIGTGSGSMKMLTDLNTELGKPKLQIGIRITTFGRLNPDFSAFFWFLPTIARRFSSSLNVQDKK